MTPAGLDRTLAALADSTRRSAVDLLRKKPRRAGDLARELAMSQPAMSRHLRVLREAGLIEEGEGDGDDARVRVYRLRQKPFAALRQWAEEVEAFWGEQLESFKEHVERAAKARK